MKAYAGIDLHSSNSYLGVINEEDQRLYSKRLPNRLEAILSALEPFREELAGVVVESTYNWYWLVDGLEADGYRVHLANPSAIRQYEGLKHTDDQWDSFWLAHLLRLNILPEGHIYPRERRSVRDLLRRRLLFVKHRTAHILSLQSMITRHLGCRMSCGEIKRLGPESAEGLFDCRHLVLIARCSLATIRFLTEKIQLIEQEVKAEVALQESFKQLLTLPGIGIILGLTIMLEAGDIHRFANVGNYGSYCRCVKSRRLSNQKNKGEGNRKNGNKYLSWAYVEAAHHAVRTCAKANRFYQQKAAQTNRVVAIKALGNKLARASYYVMRDQVPYQAEKLFR